MSFNGSVEVPSQAVTPDNHGAYITIVSALLLVGSVLVYFLRLGVRFGFNGYFGLDDILITAGTVLGIAQSVVTVIAANNGIGQNISELSKHELFLAEKLFYAGDLLYVATMALARASASQLVARLTRRREHTNACAIVSVLIGCWGVASILAIGVGCHPSRPWDLSDRCSNLIVSWDGIESSGIVLEIALLCLPVYLIWDLQMSFFLKAVVMAAFAFRLPIIPLAIGRMLELNAARASTDFTFDIVTAVIFAQVEMHYGLIAATIPCARPVLKALGTGYMAPLADQVDPVLRERNRQGDSYMLSSKGASSISKRRSERHSTTPSTVTRKEPEQHISTISETSSTETVPQIPLPAPLNRRTSGIEGYLSSTSVTQAYQGSIGPSRRPSLTQPSSAGSDKLIIKKTIDYTVRRHEAQ